MSNEYRFSLGSNSDGKDGGIGLCFSVIADTPEEAADKAGGALECMVDGISIDYEGDAFDVRLYLDHVPSNAQLIEDIVNEEPTEEVTRG